MRANMELLEGEPMDPLDILRAEISHLGQKFDAEVGALKANLAQALWELDKANAELARMAAKLGCDLIDATRLRYERDTARLLLAQAQRERDEARSENDKLRGLLAKSDKDCPYCGLPAAEISKCEQGFPGCGRMDDIISAQGTKAEADLADRDKRIAELEEALRNPRNDRQTVDSRTACRESS